MKQFLVVMYIRIDSITFHAFLTTDDISCVRQLRELLKKIENTQLCANVFYCVLNGKSMSKGDFQTPAATLIFACGSKQFGLAGYSQDIPMQSKSIQVTEEWLEEFDDVLKSVNIL